jgi:cytochrome c biogenesis protein CcdA
MNSHIHTLSNGICGVVASFAGVVTTFQMQLEWWVRISGGVLGVFIGILTLINLLRKKD